MELHEIEHKIACNEMSAAQVFTQMLQHIRSNEGELVAQISELALGYREGKTGEILKALAEMKLKAMKHEQNEQVEKLFDLVDELSDIKEDILSDA